MLSSWLGRYLGRDRRRLSLTLVLLLPVALAGAIQPLLVGQAIAVMRRFAGDTKESVLPLLQGMDTSQALRLIVVVLLLSVLLRLALQGVQTFNIQAVGQRLTARIRQDLFAHAMSLSVRFHDRMPVGKLLTRLTSDVDALAEVFGSGAVGVLGDLVSLVVIAATMLLVEWRLGLLFENNLSRDSIKLLFTRPAENSGVAMVIPDVTRSPEDIRFTSTSFGFLGLALVFQA